MYGVVEKQYEDIEDFVIIRSNGQPLYVLTNAVDDIRDRITHVIRGQDGLANTPKQILLYKALGAPVPKFAHMSLTLDPKFFTDPKAISVNAHYLRNLPVEEILPHVKSELEKAGMWDPAYEGEKRDWFARTVDLIRSRYHVLTDFGTLGRAYFADDYPIDPKPPKKNVLKHEGLKEWFPMVADRLEAIETFTLEEIERIICEMGEELEIKPGIIINGIRTVVTGQAAGPGIFDILIAVGQERVVDRLRKAVKFFGCL